MADSKRTRLWDLQGFQGQVSNPPGHLVQFGEVSDAGARLQNGGFKKPFCFWL